MGCDYRIFTRIQVRVEWGRRLAVTVGRHRRGKRRGSDRRSFQ